TTRFHPGSKETTSGERLRNPRAVRSRRRKIFPGRSLSRATASQPHRHDDVEVPRGSLEAPLGRAEALRVLVLQLELDVLGLGLVEKVQEVLGVQPDRER